MEDLDAADTGEFDIAFCLGILYHLENPVLAMKKLSAVTKKIIVIETEVIDIPETQSPIWMMNFPPPINKKSKAISTGLWRTEAVCQSTPNIQAVVELMKFLGFTTIKQLNPQDIKAEYHNQRRRALFIAVR